MTSAKHRRPSRGFPVSNRVWAFLVHIPHYSIEGRKRFADDCQVTDTTILRLCRGHANPSHGLASRITKELSKRLGVPLSIEEVFSDDGTYPTPRVCDLTPDCNGCFPDEAYDAADNMKPLYRRMKPGDWCTYPAATTEAEPTHLS